MFWPNTDGREIESGDDEETERWRGKKGKSEHSPWFKVR